MVTAGDARDGNPLHETSAPNADPNVPTVAARIFDASHLASQRDWSHLTFGPSPRTPAPSGFTHEQATHGPTP
ncbi:hypothetical protein GCM10022399_28740 [Terrabacter ginsenosidimutans]|uniref:Uncharacterized protein n=1 Tax=Terrabacter ginsenosidimutans TaxID=490575 RepID=A0ABP7DX10_9MICO